MKIHILSDLHIEFGDFEFQYTDADVVLFAGDIGVGIGGLKWIESLEIDKPVIYVLGNHEFYHHDISLLETIRESAPENIHVLDNDVVLIDDVQFLGTSLWTDFLLFGEVDKYHSIQNAKKNMADFEVIEYFGRRFTPEDSIRMHEESRDWLRHMLSTSYDGKTVVITHHLPSSQSVPMRFSQDLLTPAFASNLEELMDVDRLKLWVHGHTHDAYDYTIYGTRVVCNPRGYFGYEISEDFKPGFVVEI